MKPLIHKLLHKLNLHYATEVKEPKEMAKFGEYKLVQRTLQCHGCELGGEVSGADKVDGGLE